MKTRKLLAVLLAAALILAALPAGTVPAGASGYVPYYEYGDFFCCVNYDENGDPVSIAIVDYLGGGGDVIIPSECDGLPVTEIRSFADDYYGEYHYAFKNHEEITSVAIPDSVTGIGGRAFRGCTGLTSITIPDSVTEIRYETFYGCTGLTSINIPDSVTYIGDRAFAYCTGLTSVTIPDSVTSIEDSTFYGCTSLTFIDIPDSVTSIEKGAFSGCTGLTSVSIGSGLTTIPSGLYSPSGLKEINVSADNPNYSSLDGVLFNKDKTELIQYPAAKEGNSYIIPDSVAEIGYKAFWNCTGLTAINVDENNPKYASVDGVVFNKDKTTLIQYPDGKQGSYAISAGVTSIGEYAFSGCTGLTSVTIGSGVTEIGGWAFSDCTGLTSVSLPDSVTYIGDGAFYGCTGLTSVTIGDGVTGIGEWAFWGCTGLTAITIPDGVTDIRERAFWNCTGLTSIVIPDSVTSIGDHAFSGCTGLTDITLGDGLTKIQSGLFSDTAYYKDEANWENGVLYIGKYLIKAKDSLSGEYKIKGGTRLIADDAFYGCTGLTAINVDENNPNYASADGVLFNKDKTELIQYPAAKEGNSYIIPDSVTSIGDGAFDGCTGLTSIVIPDSVTSIGNEAFYGCTGLTSITIPDGVTSIGNYAFSNTAYYNNEANWENGVLYIGKCLIKAKDSLSGEYKIKKGTKIIADGAFGDWNESCTGLTSITIPDSVTDIGYKAFDGCTTLTIYGFAGSTAEAYANENDISFVAVERKTVADEPTGIAVTDAAPHALPDGAKLKVEKSEATDKGITYGISLVNQDGEPVQPNGSVTVKLPVPDGMDPAACRVYRQEDDGSYTDMHAAYDGAGFMVFTTDHFSIYIVTVEILGVQPGDVNLDGMIDAGDAVLVLCHDAQLIVLTGQALAAGDVNFDGVVDAGDAVLILRCDAELITGF